MCKLKPPLKFMRSHIQDIISLQDMSKNKNELEL